jgi:hypothetical protein
MLVTQGSKLKVTQCRDDNALVVPPAAGLQSEMILRFKASTLLAAAMWLYFIVAIILYVYLNVAWVNTFDFLFGAFFLVILSVWYVIDRIRYRDPSRPRTSRWAIGPYGMICRRGSGECPPQNPQK